MIAAPNTFRPGVVGGFIIEPAAEILPVVFSLAPIAPSTAINTTWISVGGAPGGWVPTVGEQMEFVIGDNHSGMPMVVGAAFNYRGGWLASTGYAAGDAFIAYDGSGILQTWLTLTAFTSGSSSIFVPTADVKQMNFRGAWAPATAYTAGDVVLAPDTFGVTQTWVALSGFTSAGTFAAGTQWAGCLASYTTFYVVAVNAGTIEVSTTLGGSAIAFMSSGFFAAPDVAPQLSAYFGVPSFSSGGGLTPTLTVGALWANGTAWVPTSAPAVPAAPVNQFSYLGYNSSLGTGLYWTTNPLGTTAGDAILGWVETNDSDIIAASFQDIPVEAGSGSSTGGPNTFAGPIGSIPVSAPAGGGNIGALVTMEVAGNVITPDATEAYNVFTLLTDMVLALPANCPVYPQVEDTTIILLQGIGAPVFSGSGINNLSSQGKYTTSSIPDTPHTYLIQISATGPDYFTWSKDGGAMSAPVACGGGAPQALSDGITITFAVSAGHHIGDQWSVQVGGFSVDTSAYGQGKPALSGAQSPAGTECIVLLLCNTAGIRFLSTQVDIQIP